MPDDKFSRPAPDSLPLIRAGELARYSFCHRAWWLGTVKGIPTENRAALARGQSGHHRHLRHVQNVRRWRWGGWFLLGGGGLLLAAALVWFLLLQVL